MMDHVPSGEQLAASIEREWYARTVPEDRPRERAVPCRFVFTTTELEGTRCPGSTFHTSGLCEFHRQGALYSLPGVPR